MSRVPGYQEAQWLWVYKREAQAHPNTEEFFAHRSVLNIFSISNLSCNFSYSQTESLRLWEEVKGSSMIFRKLGAGYWVGASTADPSRYFCGETQCTDVAGR